MDENKKVCEHCQGEIDADQVDAHMQEAHSDMPATPEAGQGGQTDTPASEGVVPQESGDGEQNPA